MNRVFPTIVLLTLASLLASATALADPIPTVIYREIFPNGTSPLVNISATSNPTHWDSTGWDSYQGNSGTRMTGGAATTTGWYIPVNKLDQRVGIATVGINSNPCCSTDVGHYILWTAKPPGNQVLLFTEEYTVDRNIWDVTKIEWWQTFTAPVSAVRVALKIGDDWYASDQSFATATSSVPHSLPFESALWRPLTFSPGSELTLGSSTGALPSTGDITAFGHYVDAWNGHVRLDTYEIWAVPEPSGLTLLSLPLVGLLFRRRRRTR